VIFSRKAGIGVEPESFYIDEVILIIYYYDVGRLFYIAGHKANYKCAKLLHKSHKNFSTTWIIERCS